MSPLQKRRIVVAGGALALLAATAQAPRADIQILTHDRSDSTPAKVQAAVDLGVVAVSVLVTWTRKISY